MNINRDLLSASTAEVEKKRSISMKISKRLRIYIGASITAGTVLLTGVASAGTQVGTSESVSGTRTAVVTSGEEHVCTYEQRPVTRTYNDSSGGSYERRTYETVRVCTHEPEYSAERAPEKVYKETRRKARKERRKSRRSNYGAGVGYYGGSPSVHGGVHYGTSAYHRPYYHHYGHYGRHHYRHHYPRSSFSRSFGGSHHGYRH